MGAGRNAVALSAGVNGIYLLRANLYVALQINPLTACLTGECGEVMKLFNRCGSRVRLEKGNYPTLSVLS
ncbi:hypothetical protein F9626_24345 [Escherichia coli]|nr:hypothetical protein [Escherichia coli]